jgi:hypothetical protein
VLACMRCFWCYCCCCACYFKVGYIATKTYKDRSWRMSITAGEDGPVFTVSARSVVAPGHLGIAHSATCTGVSASGSGGCHMHHTQKCTQ